jgi:hypothetical protein
MDTESLLAGLTEYKQSLEQHLAKLQSDYGEMKQRTWLCSRVYEGSDATEFWSHWHRTDEEFLEYTLEVSKLIPMLNERIDVLRQFERGGGASGLGA